MNKRLGDALRAALRPFGLSQSSLSQAKPAVAIARRDDICRDDFPKGALGDDAWDHVLRGTHPFEALERALDEQEGRPWRS